MGLSSPILIGLSEGWNLSPRGLGNKHVAALCLKSRGDSEEAKRSV